MKLLFFLPLLILFLLALERLLLFILQPDYILCDAGRETEG